MVSKIFFRGKSTSDKSAELLSLFRLILTDANLDSRARIIEMLKETRSRLESSIQSSGHSYASKRISARYNPLSYIDEMLGGVSYLASVKELLEVAENDFPSLLARLSKLRSTILDESTFRKGALLNLTGDQRVLERVQPSVDKFLSSLPGKADGTPLPNFYKQEHPWSAAARAKMSEHAPVVDEGFVVSTKVNYVGKGGLLFSPGEKMSGATTVVSRYLKTGYLWDHVRVIGGAYGGFCSLSSSSGVFTFLSYRDPNFAKTLDIYDAASESLAEAADNITDEALALAIIGTIGDMDGAHSPDQKGWISFRRWLANESAESRQKYRDEVIGTKKEDFKTFAAKLKTLTSTLAVVSSRNGFEEAKKSGHGMSMLVRDVV